MSSLSAFPAWEPPFAGTDADHLAGSLDRLRATFRWKADGLTTEQLRFRLPTSALSLGVLLKHLAVCEDDIFAHRILGERPEALAALPAGTDPHTAQFTLTDDDTAEALYTAYDAAVRRSRARFGRIAAILDKPAALEFERIHPSARRHVHDLVEEYGRHVGHADLIREALDGRVGEDPDEDWRWPVLAE